MKVGLGLLSLGILALISCGGRTSSVVVTNDDPAAIRNAPGGVATLVFMDLETIRPDNLPFAVPVSPQPLTFGLAPAATLPGCVTSAIVGTTATYTFTGCKAANTGVLSGTATITVAPTVPPATTTVYTEVFNLTVAVDATKSWHYTGTQTITVNTATSNATLAVSANAPIQAVYTDTATPANNKTYAFSASLTSNWATAGHFTLAGGYAFVRSGLENITVAIAPADPLTWTSSCDFPGSGTLSINLVSTVNGTASTTAVFGPSCGQVSIGGGSITLGSH